MLKIQSILHCFVTFIMWFALFRPFLFLVTTILVLNVKVYVFILIISFVHKPLKFSGCSVVSILLIKKFKSKYFIKATNIIKLLGLLPYKHLNLKQSLASMCKTWAPSRVILEDRAQIKVWASVYDLLPTNFLCITNLFTS